MSDASEVPHSPKPRSGCSVRRTLTRVDTPGNGVSRGRYPFVPLAGYALVNQGDRRGGKGAIGEARMPDGTPPRCPRPATAARSEEHTSELQSRENLVC